MGLPYSRKLEKKLEAEERIKPVSRNIYVYLRRSKREVGLEHTGDYSQSIHIQKAKCDDFIGRFLASKFPEHKHDPKHHVFIDDGVSGTRPIAQRPAGGRMGLSLKPGDIVVMASWDRGFRSVLNCLQTIDDWRNRNIYVYACNLPVDVSDDIQYASVKFAAIMAETEHAMICKRQRDSSEAMVRSLRLIGNPPIGFKAIGTKRNKMCVPCEDERRLCQYVWDTYYAEDMSCERLHWHFRKLYLSDKKKYAWLIWRKSNDVPSDQDIFRILKAVEHNYPYYKGLDYEQLVKENIERTSVLYSKEGLEALKGMRYKRPRHAPNHSDNVVLPHIEAKLAARDVVSSGDRECVQPGGDRPGREPGVRDVDDSDSEAGVGGGEAEVRDGGDGADREADKRERAEGANEGGQPGD